MKLLLAIPTHDYHHVEFTRSLIKLIQRLDDEKIDYTIHMQSGTLVYMARDALAAEAVNGGYTHVLWLDADMVFEGDLFDRLVRHGNAMTTGVYHARRPPYDSCIFSTLNPPIKVISYPAEPFGIGGCGFGCILMETKVLVDVFRKFGNCFQPSPELGEDLEFCKKATTLGYTVVCDPSIQCGHIGQIVVKPNMKNGAGLNG